MIVGVVSKYHFKKHLIKYSMIFFDVNILKHVKYGFN